MAVHESVLQLASALPWPVLALILLAAIATLRVASNQLSFSGRPPVFEGLPFVGGLLKFMGVSTGLAGPPVSATSLTCACCRAPYP